MNRPIGPANRTLPQTTRRDVIKLGGAIAAGAVLSSGVPCVHAASDNTIRLALIGCGGRGRGAVADAFSVATSPIKLHAMADLTDQRVNSAHGVLQKAFADRVDVPADRRFAGSTRIATRSTACGRATWPCSRPTPTAAPCSSSTRCRRA